MNHKLGKAYFLQFVDIGEPWECWIWSGYINNTGYGQYGKRLAHRIMYELVIGPLPEGRMLDHACHNTDATCSGGLCRHRRCVNPHHLQLASCRKNVLASRLTVASKNAAKTHCPNGHPYTEDNLIVYSPNGKFYGRRCRECQRKRQRAYNRKRYAARIS